MAGGQVDPARLNGEELHRWYVRSPSDIEQGRQAADQQRYRKYFGEPRGAGHTEDLSELRRQQAEFEQVRRETSKQNSWLAVPALAPAAVVMGLEGTAALAGNALRSQAVKAPLSFLEREAWQGRAASALKASEKATLRESGRARYAQANGLSASRMQSQVHHSDPLEYAHLKPNADPNRLANLWALRPEAHKIASREWAAFRASLKGRIPSQAEIMAIKMKIDRMVEPYIRRAGVPRSNKPPGQGGPR